MATTTKTELIFVVAAQELLPEGEAPIEFTGLVVAWRVLQV